MTVKRWLRELEAASKHEKEWRKRAKEVVDRYRDESRKDTQRSEFNILWSNTETLKPAIYSHTPTPDVRRRFKDEDVIGREVAKILERSLSYSIDTYDFDGVIERVVQDYLLPGRGVARVRYIPTMGLGDRPKVRGMVQSKVNEMGELYQETLFDGEAKEPEGYDEEGPFILGEPEEEVVWEEARVEYVLWENYRQSSEPQWEDKRWIAFGTEMTRKEMVDQFGEVGKRVPLKERKEKEGSTADGGEADEHLRKGRVWEIWDKQARKVCVIAEDFDEYLLEQDDPLNLRNFFPCPEPIYSVRTNDSSIPIPEFTMYQDQARELDLITDRIAKLTSALKVRGLYDAQFKEWMSQLLNGNDNELIPAEGFSILAEKGGLDGAITWMPVEQIGKVLVGLFNERNQIINTIYEITGISDILRGATDPRETATAQRLKGQFGSMRIQPRQHLIQVFVRDLFRIKAEIIAELFDPQILEQMTQVEVSPQMVELLHSDAMRTYRVDIETDSTIAADEARDKQDVVEFFGAMGEFIQGVGPLIQQGTLPAESALALLKWGARRFKVSRDIEDEISASMQEQQPQENPEEQAQMQEMQTKLQEMQAEMQLKQQEFEQEQARKDAEVQAKIEAIMAQIQRQDALAAAKIESQRRADLRA